MKSLSLPLIALALAACATPSAPAPDATAQPKYEEKEYRIGSRIPVRDPSASASPVKTLDPSVLNSGVPPRAP